MTKVVRINDIAQYVGQTVTIQGWLRSKRSSKKLQFLQIRDGALTIQGIVSLGDHGEELFQLADQLTQECAVTVTGIVQEDPRSPIGYELHVNALQPISPSVDYPISNKAHGDAFLMEHRHLWLRSKRQQAILKIRHTLSKAIRDYFDSRDFTLIDSPIFTPNACEGTSTLFSTEYFGQTAYLTQSGQLYQEAGAMAFGKTYCFGPTFRAEKSKTRRHLTEFWMVEPEVAYMDLEGDMDLAEDFLCNIVATVLEKHEDDLVNTLKRDLTVLKNVKGPFERISYDKAFEMIAALRDKTNDAELKSLLALEWGDDFGSPHETQLTKQFDRPIMVHSFPAAIKAFYMKRDPQNDKLSRCVDVLAPEGYGEIIGGGQREDNIDILQKAMQTHELPAHLFEWFLDLRRYGSVPHAGFGMGLERTVAWICGLNHVRETIPFARTIERLTP